MKRGNLIISLACNACKQVRPDIDLGCESYSPIDNVTTFFRFCKDKPTCKETAQLHKRDRLLS